MKKENKIAIIVLIGFLSILWIGKPFREYLTANFFDEVIANRISGTIVRSVLLILAILLIKKLHLRKFNGISPIGKVKNIHSMILPMLFVSIGFVNNFETYRSTQPGVLLLFTVSVIVIGLVEELIFRGILLPLFIRGFANNKRPIIISAVLSSFMFGAVHFFNLFRQPHNLVGVTSQVFFALSIGVFFCGLMVRTENILIPGILHALVNFSFSAGELKQNVKESTKIITENGIQWNSVIPTTIFFTFIFCSGIYMIIKSNKDSILNKLSSNR